MDDDSPTYLREPITNGNPHEQALIRRWWHESHGARGLLIWEYPLFGRWLDAVWFPDVPGVAVEESGSNLPTRFPLNGATVVVCEAKRQAVTPALIGRALVHAAFARRAGALVNKTIIFGNSVASEIRGVALDLGLEVVAEVRLSRGVTAEGLHNTPA